MANTTAKYFEAGNGPYSGAYVGTGNGSGANALSTCYFQFKTGDSGATKISFQTSNATADVRGSSHSDDGIAAMRFAVSTSSTQYKKTKSSTAGYAAEGSYGKYIKGSLSIKLLPNTTYYLWVFPNSSFPGTTRFALGSCTVTLTGTYGTASTISASSGTFGSAVTITLANSVSGVTNTVSMSFTAGGTTRTINTSTSNGGLVKNSDAKYTWTPTLAQYGTWITSAKSVTVTITCATSYGSSSWGSSTKPITMTFPNSCAPTLSLSSPTYDNSGSAAASIAKFVQGYSKLRVNASATPQYSASIKKYEIIYNGVTTSITSSDTSKVLTTSNAAVSSGTVTATIKVTDTRDFVTTGTQDFTILPYANPVFESVELLRCKQEGSQYVADEGGAFLSAKVTGSISSLDNGNEIVSLIVECNKAADNTSMFAPDTSANLTNNPQTADIFPGLDPNYTWIATVTITDKLGNSASSRKTISSQKWAIKFNATATAVGFGKAPEVDNVLEIPNDWDIVKGTAPNQQHAIFSGGDTMTGNLNIIKDAPAVNQKSSTINSKIGQTIPSSNSVIGGHHFNDSQDYLCGYDEIIKTTADDLYRSFVVRRQKSDGTDVANGFYLHVNSSGTASVTWTGSSKNAWRSALGIAGMADGLKIKYGSGTTNSSGQLSVTFSGTAFTSTPVILVSAHGTDASSLYDARPASSSTSGFTIYCVKQKGSTTSAGTNIPVRWIAIGT